MLKLWIILLSTGLLSNFCFAQSENDADISIFSWNFYTYLKESGLEENAITWLEDYPDSLRNDTINNRINFELVKLYVAKNNIDKAVFYLKKISFFTDTTDIKYAIYLSVAALDTLLVQNFLYAYPYCLSVQDKADIIASLAIIRHQDSAINTIQTTLLSDEISAIVQEYNQHKKKSPLLAGILSALLPGLGKYYMGYTYQAVSAFTMNAVLGAILLEGILKGTTVLRWAIPLPVFVVFYTGNILGSVVLAKKREIDFRNNTNDKIKTYYRNKLLYRP